MGRLSRINRALKGYDRSLFATAQDGRISIKRMAYTFDVFDYNGTKILASRPQPQPVMDLTDNWNIGGTPVEWGIEPILARLKAIDIASNPTLFEDMMKGYEKLAESKERDFTNNVESFLLDFRRQFAKTFNDINTSTMEKIDKRRLYDGYRK